jgi:hypothetical protein
MACCAFGPCDNSIEKGGKGCYLCDKVAKNLVHPALPRQKDSVTRGDKNLTSVQKKKASKK